VQIQIPVQHDFNYDECLIFLGRNREEILYRIADNQIHRLIAIGDEFVPIVVSYQEGQLKVEIITQAGDSEPIKAYVERWFDTQRDLSNFYQILSSTAALKPLLHYRGLRIIGVPDLFESLCWTIIGQQINLAFAYKLKSRLTQAYGHSKRWNDQELWHFPAPEDLLEISESFREANQFSRSKVKYLMNTAKAFACGDISFNKLKALPSFEERQQLLTQVKGIGEWSANYVLMKTLHQPEAIPYGDTGLTQSLYNLGIIKDRNDRPAIEAFFKTVKGWEAYTSFYLWRSLYD